MQQKGRVQPMPNYSGNPDARPGSKTPTSLRRALWDTNQAETTVHARLTGIYARVRVTEWIDWDRLFDTGEVLIAYDISGYDIRKDAWRILLTVPDVAALIKALDRAGVNVHSGWLATGPFNETAPRVGDYNGETGGYYQ